MRCALLLDTLGSVDRSGCRHRVAYIFPAATLRTWMLDRSELKGAKRAEILDWLEKLAQDEDLDSLGGIGPGAQHPSSSVAWRTRGRSVVAPPADHAGLRLRPEQQVSGCVRNFGHPQARELGVNHETLRNWVKAYAPGASRRAGRGQPVRNGPSWPGCGGGCGAGAGEGDLAKSRGLLRPGDGPVTRETSTGSSPRRRPPIPSVSCAGSWRPARRCSTTGSVAAAPRSATPISTTPTPPNQLHDAWAAHRRTYGARRLTAEIVDRGRRVEPQEGRPAHDRRRTSRASTDAATARNARRSPAGSVAPRCVGVWCVVPACRVDGVGSSGGEGSGAVAQQATVICCSVS